MVEIKKVITKSDINKFIKYPIELYKGSPYFVPYLNSDEKNKFDPKKNESYDNCITQAFLAYKDGKIVGRILGIIQTLYNQKVNEKRLRFSRFDSIDDAEVSNALFKAVEDWGKAKGMELFHGPLGYNDWDREGLLIEGFDQPQTFEEQYNYDYYPKLVEAYGFKKETDWYEYRIFKPKQKIERIARISEMVLKRYDLKFITIGKKDKFKKFVAKYKEGFFDCVNAAYAPLHGVVPLTDKVKEALTKQFLQVLQKEYICLVVDKDDRVVAIGLAIPSLSESVSKSKGRLTLGVLMSIIRPKGFDFALIAVRPEYQGKGVNAVIMNYVVNYMREKNIPHAETNLMLEDNSKIQKQWEDFDYIQHKKRRCYVKGIK